MKYENLSRSIWMVLVVLGTLMVFPGSIKADNNSVVNMNSKSAIKKAFWTEVEQISKLKGDVVSGEAVFALCESCHRADTHAEAPSLENAGSLYDKTYLIALIKNPAIAMNPDHKYADSMMHPMGAISVMVPNEQDIANVVAYIKKNKIEKTRHKEVNTLVDTKIQSELHLILGIKKNSILESFMKVQAVQLKSFMNDQNINYSNLCIGNDWEITFDLLNTQDVAKVKKVLEVIPGISLHENALKFSFKILDKELPEIKNKAIQHAIEIIQNRLSQFGLTGYTVLRQGTEKILVDVSGLKNTEEKERITQLVTHSGILQLMVAGGQKKTRICEDTVLVDTNVKEEYLLQTIPVIFASRMDEVKVGFDADNQPIVDFSLRQSDTKRLKNFTGKNIGKQIAVVLDNKVYSTSIIDRQVDNGHGQISKNLSLQNAHDLAIVLRSGAMLAAVYVLGNDLEHTSSMLNVERLIPNPKEVFGEQKQSTDGCKSKTFTDLQLAAVEAFEEGDQKKSLELFQEAYHLCPTDEMTKDMIRDLK